MVLQLDRNLHIVNAPPLAKRDPQLATGPPARTSQSWVERFESASTAEQREPVVRSRSPIGAIGVEIAPSRSRRDGRVQRPHQQTHDAFIAARDMVECRAASAQKCLVVRLLTAKPAVTSTGENTRRHTEAWKMSEQCKS